MERLRAVAQVGPRLSDVQLLDRLFPEIVRSLWFAVCAYTKESRFLCHSVMHIARLQVWLLRL